VGRGRGPGLPGESPHGPVHGDVPDTVQKNLAVTWGPIRLGGGRSCCELAGANHLEPPATGSSAGLQPSGRPSGAAPSSADERRQPGHELLGIEQDMGGAVAESIPALLDDLTGGIDREGRKTSFMAGMCAGYGSHQSARFNVLRYPGQSAAKIGFPPQPLWSGGNAFRPAFDRLKPPIPAPSAGEHRALPDSRATSVHPAG